MIDILAKNKEKDLQELLSIFENYLKISSNNASEDNISTQNDIYRSTKLQITKYNDLCIREGIKNAN